MSWWLLGRRRMQCFRRWKMLSDVWQVQFVSAAVLSWRFSARAEFPAALLTNYWSLLTIFLVWVSDINIWRILLNLLYVWTAVACKTYALYWAIAFTCRQLGCFDDHLMVDHLLVTMLDLSAQLVCVAVGHLIVFEHTAHKQTTRVSNEPAHQFSAVRHDH